MTEADRGPEPAHLGAALAELDRIVQRLESDGELELEEALALWERGVTLATDCRQLLAAAQLRLTEVPPDPSAASDV